MTSGHSGDSITRPKTPQAAMPPVGGPHSVCCMALFAPSVRVLIGLSTSAIPNGDESHPCDWVTRRLRDGNATKTS